MKRFVAAAAVGIAALSPVMIPHQASTVAVFVADGGRSYSGQSVQSNPRQPATTTTSSPSQQPAQPKPATDPVGAAIKTGTDVLGIFGR